MLEDSHSRKDTFDMKMYITVELRYNEPLYNEVLGIAINYFLTRPKIVKYMAISKRTSM